MTDALPPLEDCGFIRVPSDGEPLWMTCEKCGKSDHFWLAEEQIRCRCGARYSHAVRPDGDQVPASDLEQVPFKEGPMQLADLEISPLRLALAIGVGLGLIGSAIWWLSF